MTNNDLDREWLALEPDILRRKRMERHIFEWLDARETSLFSQWIDLIKVRPVASLGYTFAGALSLLVAAPVSWVVSAGLI